MRTTAVRRAAGGAGADSAGIVLSREGDAWVREEGVEDCALPVYEGRMVNIYDWSQKEWVRGRGREADWQPIPAHRKYLQPQYLMAEAAKPTKSTKIGFLSVGSGTNARSFYCAVLPDLPCGNSVGTLDLGHNAGKLLWLQSQLSGFLFDFVLRLRLVGLNLNYFVVGECPAQPVVPGKLVEATRALVARLSLTSPRFAVEQVDSGLDQALRPGSVFIAPRERMQARAVLDAIAFATARLDHNDVRHLLAGCDSPTPVATVENSKGFWRVDRDRRPEHRLTTLAQIAFADLESKTAASGDKGCGIEAFLAQNHGDGWQMPETLRLADYGLGHDDRAKHSQPVASCLGPRFYDWQLTQNTDQASQECHIHARNLLGAKAYRQFEANSKAATSRRPKPRLSDHSASQLDLLTDGSSTP